MTRIMPERHTAENIATRLKNSFSEFQLDKKVKACVHDNARNMEKAGTMCPDWSDSSCFAHTLQLCIKPVLELPAASKVLGKCRKLVGHFKHSTTLTAELHKRQELQHRDSQRKEQTYALIQDVPTRWSSTQQMCARLLQLRRVITDILLDEDVTRPSDIDLLFKDHEWAAISDLAKALQPFTNVTTFMSKDKTVSISEIFPIISELVTRTLLANGENSALTTTVKQLLTSAFHHRFEPFTAMTADSLPMLASLLDPRYKKLNFLPSHLRRLTLAMLEARMDDVPLKIIVRETSPATPSKRPRLDFLMSSPDAAEDDELKMYLAEMADDPTPALEWWYRNESTFPKVAHVAYCLCLLHLCQPKASSPQLDL